MEPTRLTFWEKMMELQVKMLLLGSDSPQQHMYMSSPLEWPLLTRGIAYWVSTESNAQVHLLGNIAVWLTGTACMVLYSGLLVLYLMRRRRLCYDVPEGKVLVWTTNAWVHFCKSLFLSEVQS
jgi:dolichyl-phosphate-mannose-protein mannosyltransferase